MFQPKQLFVDRMNLLLKEESDRDSFWQITRKDTINSIRVNTLKITPNELKSRLESRGWKLVQPYPDYPEIMIIDSDLLPGELGKSREHLLGYYYVQEISSMLSMLALKPENGELLLDLCAAPGSKTSQAAAMMENKGTIIANDMDFGRVAILASNLEKSGVSNTLVTRHDGIILCDKLARVGMKFDKILVDAPCSGEGTLRSSPKTLLMWNIKMIEKLSRLQKKLASNALGLLKEGGELVYSTCTHAPEENEEVVQYLLDNFNIEIQDINLPIKTRSGIAEWRGKTFDKNIAKACRVYPQDNNTEGFFLCKIKKLGEKQ